LVDTLLSIPPRSAFWLQIGQDGALAQLARVEPPDTVVASDDAYLDLVAEAFASVIDAKSPWTYRHSNGVADLSATIATRMGFGPEALRDLKRAALLHDLGKLGVSNLILDKPDRLNDTEVAIVRLHPAHTQQILLRVGCFRHLSDVASAHHERLDGHGYHRGYDAGKLNDAARVLCIADICEALRSTRPYRPGLNAERILEIMGRDVDRGIDGACFEAVRAVLTDPTSHGEGGAPAVRVVSALAEDYHQAA
jgi:HD-GYP domain-containing protein (c-di-GMP phosphodiesterase class II)